MFIGAKAFRARKGGLVRVTYKAASKYGIPVKLLLAIIHKLRHLPPIIKDETMPLVKPSNYYISTIRLL